jgi:hypothetical protein
MSGVSEDDFIKDMQDRDFASGVYDMMVSRKLIENPKEFSFGNFYQPFNNFYAESQKKAKPKFKLVLETLLLAYRRFLRALTFPHPFRM